MKEIISKELLSEVLGEKVSNIYGFTNSINDLEYKLLSTVDGNSINIYELEHRCKGWALENSEYTSFCTQFEKYQFSCYLYKYISIYADKCNTCTFSGTTEPEAIFKACQWIYENKQRGE